MTSPPMRHSQTVNVSDANRRIGGRNCDNAGLETVNIGDDDLPSALSALMVQCKILIDRPSESDNPFSKNSNRDERAISARTVIS